MKSIQKVGLIGSGNVASHVAKVFFDHNISIEIIVGRSEDRAKELAKQVDARSTDSFSQLSQLDLDLIIVAVNDQNISLVSDQLKNIDTPIVHTSGATSQHIFEKNHNTYGVFYPLQTMTKGLPLDFSAVPICIDSNKEKCKHRLEELALKISNKVFHISDQQRQWLHLNAVLINNNINHLLAKVKDVLLEQGLPEEILLPLLQVTIDKTDKIHPKDIQTGPAKRNDLTSKQVHLKLIDTLDDEHLKEIYLAFWNSIQSYHNGSN